MRLTQLDGAIPNLTIMKLASWHLERDDEIHVTRHIDPMGLWDLGYDRVYGSVLFDFSADRLARFRRVSGVPEDFHYATSVIRILGEYDLPWKFHDLDRALKGLQALARPGT